MSRSAPRHAAPKHARTGPTASGGPRTVDLGQVRHHAVTPVRTRGRRSRAAGIAAITAAVVAVSGGGYALSEASSADVVTGGSAGAAVIVTVSAAPTPTAPTPTAPTPTAPTPTASVRSTRAASTPRPTPSPTAMRGAGTVALTPDTLAARERAVEAAAAAKKAKARAAAAAKASRSSDRTAPPGGSPKAIARALMANYGWGDDQFSCLVTMWNHESGWNPRAENPGSGAYGIPQALPGIKMAKYGSDWRSNPATQISWGLNYIKTRYNTPCGAWSFWQRGSWY
jgi:Transglycosylase SLT domain